MPLYYIQKDKTECPNKLKEEVQKEFVTKVKALTIETIDGVKIIRDDGWILIRPSGTEPLYRCFAEGKTQETADRLSKEGVELIERAKKLV